MVTIIVYMKPTCPYCQKAITLLESKGVDLTLIDITDNSTLREEMIQKSGRTTVPQIFINGELIGGCDDLHALSVDELNKKLGVSK